jgi:5-dehydro-2-deoxygluconokinase
MVGRSLWVHAATRWLRGELDDETFVAATARNFMELVEAWRASRPARAVAATVLRAA